MKTMEKLCERFAKLHEGYVAALDTVNSYTGWYIVYISDCNWFHSAAYTFKSCRDFREWMDGVVLD